MASAGRASRRRGACLSAIAVAIALGASGCGDSGGEAAAQAAEPLGPETGGSVASVVECQHWRGGTEAEKLATIDAIRAQVNRGDTGIEAPPLTDEEAMGLFDRACVDSYSDTFRLYLLYTRQAGFAPLQRAIEGE